MKTHLWYLQFEGTEFGPFTLAELKSTLGARKIRGTLYVCHLGMANWVEPHAIPELAPLLRPETIPVSSKRRPRIAQLGRAIHVTESRALEQRSEERQTLVATVSMVTPPRTRLMLGICEDITTRGVQIILDADHEISENVDFTLEVHPIGISGVPTFRARAKAVWSRSGEHRVGFRFEKLNSVDRKGLELYLVAATRKRIHQPPG